MLSFVLNKLTLELQNVVTNNVFLDKINTNLLNKLHIAKQITKCCDK